jgi:lipopolysaccharide export system protein LptA
MILKPTLINIISLALAIFTLSSVSHSLPEDSEKEIFIASDSASLDKPQGELIYLGNVELTQGTLNIQADKVTILRNENGLEKVIANGKPARFEQVLSANEDKTQAFGETIIYHTSIKELTLLKNAGLKKQGNEFSGEKIVYLIQEQRVKADSPQPEERIRMVIQPKMNKEP